MIPICICLVCYRRCRGHLHQENIIVANSAYAKINSQKVCDTGPFQSGIWSSRYFQYGLWHDSHPFPLSFDSQSMKVTASGSDDVGVFTIDGTYSTETNRIDLTKTYLLGTGDSSKNSGHQVTIQLIWNTQNDQFEGKWSVQTSIFYDDAVFELRFCRRSIASTLLLIF